MLFYLKVLLRQNDCNKYVFKTATVKVEFILTFKLFGASVQSWCHLWFFICLSPIYQYRWKTISLYYKEDYDPHLHFLCPTLFLPSVFMVLLLFFTNWKLTAMKYCATDIFNVCHFNSAMIPKLPCGHWPTQPIVSLPLQFYCSWGLVFSLKMWSCYTYKLVFCNA